MCAYIYSMCTHVRVCVCAPCAHRHLLSFSFGPIMYNIVRTIVGNAAPNPSPHLTFIFPFLYSRTAGKHEARGHATNKREARTKAAQAMLDELRVRTALTASSAETPHNADVSLDDDSLSSSLSSMSFNDSSNTSIGSTQLNTSSRSSPSWPLASAASTLTKTSSPLSPSSIANPIGLLNEHAQKLVLDPPEYRDEQRSGPVHLPQFTVSCSMVGQRPVTGTGSTKKAAKTLAALNMCRAIGLAS